MFSVPAAVPSSWSAMPFEYFFRIPLPSELEAWLRDPETAEERFESVRGQPLGRQYRCALCGERWDCQCASGDDNGRRCTT